MSAAVLIACGAACSSDATGRRGTGGNGSTGGGNAPGVGGAGASGPGIQIGGSTASSGQSSTGDVCNAESREGQRVPLDMFFLVDSSLSMDEDVAGGTRWEAVSGALIGFLDDPRNADIGVGLGYFPAVPATACRMGDPGCICILTFCFELSFTLASCEPADYSTPAVPLVLPPTAARVVADLRARQLNGGTPTRPALEGAVQYVTSWASAHPDRKSVIVLATDGEPAGCTQNTPQDVANVAAAALSSPLAIQTFVIGVGDSLQSLNLIAQAGGTRMAFLVEDSNASAAFAEALEQIRGVASPCDFVIPTHGSDGVIDPGRVNVKYTPTGSSTPVLVAKTFGGDAASCGPEGGWYYDSPAAPTTIKLCPATCESLSGGSVQVEFGCQTIVQPPR